MGKRLHAGWHNKCGLNAITYSSSPDLKNGLVQVDESRARYLREHKRKELQLFQSLELCQALVGHVRVIEREFSELGQSLQMQQPLVRK
jgi:hypothetical protein